MARMDERARAELYKVNQEKFFISVIIIAVFLIIKIYSETGIIGMLGELTAAAVIAIYLVPYFILRGKYKVIDEMVKNKLYKLSTVFFIIEMASMIPVIAVDTFIRIDKSGTPYNMMGSAFPFTIALLMITNIYGLIRMHNEKFVTDKAANISLKDYRRKLLIKTIAATVIIVMLIVAFIITDRYMINNFEADSEVLSTWTVIYSSGTMICLLGIPVCLFLYFYYLGTRKKLQKKIDQNSADEMQAL